MKSTLITLLVCLFAYSVYSQNEQKSYYSIKLYNQISYTKIRSQRLQPNFNYHHRTTEIFTLLNPTVAFQWESKTHNLHELELTNFQVSNNNVKEIDTNVSSLVDGYNRRDINISFRFEYSLNSFIKIAESTSLNFGFGIQPYFYRTSIKPYVSTIYPESEQFIGGTFYIAPHLTFKLNKKLNFDINIPLNLMNANYYVQEINNPLFSKNQRKRTTIDFDGIPANYNVRFGLVYKI